VRVRKCDTQIAGVAERYKHRPRQVAKWKKSHRDYAREDRIGSLTGQSSRCCTASGASKTLTDRVQDSNANSQYNQRDRAAGQGSVSRFAPRLRPQEGKERKANAGADPPNEKKSCRSTSMEWVQQLSRRGHKRMYGSSIFKRAKTSVCRRRWSPSSTTPTDRHALPSWSMTKRERTYKFWLIGT